ncbi:hypothetical protein ACGFMM_31395 [Streptomyces sp. NPDC048604]
MTTPLPADEQPEFGVPSPELAARAADGFARFLAQAADDQAEEETEQ